MSVWLCVCARECVCVVWWGEQLPESWGDGCPGPGHRETGLPGDAGHSQVTRDHAVIVPRSPPDVHPHMGGHLGLPGKTTGATSHWNSPEPWAWPWGCLPSPHTYKHPPITSPGALETGESRFHPAPGLSARALGAAYFFPE